MFGVLLIGCIVLLIVVNNVSPRSYYRRPHRHYRRRGYYHESDYIPPDYEDHYDYEEEHRSRYNNSRLLNTLMFAFLLIFGIMYMEGQYKAQQATNQDNRTFDNLELVNDAPSQRTY